MFILRNSIIFAHLPRASLSLLSRLALADNFYVHLLFACAIGLPIVLPASAATYYLIKKPFLKFRVNYLVG